MAKREFDELLNDIKDILGDDTSDRSLQILEDITDTFKDKTDSDGEDWKSKYDELDKTWRAKYRDRFFQDSPKGENVPSETSTEQESETDEDEKVDYEDLFKED